MSSTQTPPADRARLLKEALLHLEWARGAAGRYLAADTPPPALPGAAPAPAPRAAVSGGQAPDGPARQRAAGAARRGEREAKAVRGPSVAALAPEARAPRLAALKEAAIECRRCKLCAERTQVVFGEGSQTPRLVIVGEAPGADEDRTGQPFVGRAGQLLTKMLAAIGLSRDDVFICNVLKCRPPGNRNPRPDEVSACRPFLREQLEILHPELVLALGSPATRELLGTERGITSLRGRFARTPDGWRVLPSYHPAYLLRNPAAKREAWQDLQRVAATLKLDLPPRA